MINDLIVTETKIGTQDNRLGFLFNVQDLIRLNLKIKFKGLFLSENLILRLSQLIGQNLVKMKFYEIHHKKEIVQFNMVYFSNSMKKL